jgi:hypothetical protein
MNSIDERFAPRAGIGIGIGIGIGGTRGRQTAGRDRTIG